MKTIGENIAALRKDQTMTQEALASAIGVSTQAISKWENNTNMPDISLLVELSEFYDVSIPEIINGERKSENMNEEVKEVAKSMSEYALAEKESMLKEIRVLSLLGLVALIIYYVIDLSGMGESNDFFANVAMYSQTLVYVVILLIPFQATGLLNKIRKNDRKVTVSKTILCVVSLVAAFLIALLIGVFV